MLTSLISTMRGGVKVLPCCTPLYMLVAISIIFTPRCAAAPSTLITEPMDVPPIPPDASEFSHFQDAYDQRLYGKLNIDVKHATTSSLEIHWTLDNLTHSDSTVEATVLCEIMNGKIISNKFSSPSDSFKFVYLNSNTEYIVCVYLLEKSKSNSSSVLHYNCQRFSTIPMVRPDSIVGLVLMLGYLVIMGGLGYFFWWRRTRALKTAETKGREELISDECYNFDGFGEQEKGRINATMGEPVEGDGSANGGGSYNRPRSAHGRGSTGACVRFSDQGEQAIHLNPTTREISF